MQGSRSHRQPQPESLGTVRLFWRRPPNDDRESETVLEESGSGRVPLCDYRYWRCCACKGATDVRVAFGHTGYLAEAHTVGAAQLNVNSAPEVEVPFGEWKEVQKGSLQIARRN